MSLPHSVYPIAAPRRQAGAGSACSHNPSTTALSPPKASPQRSAARTPRHPVTAPAHPQPPAYAPLRGFPGGVLPDRGLLIVVVPETPGAVLLPVVITSQGPRGRSQQCKGEVSHENHRFFLGPGNRPGGLCSNAGVYLPGPCRDAIRSPPGAVRRGVPACSLVVQPALSKPAQTSRRSSCVVVSSMRTECRPRHSPLACHVAPPVVLMFRAIHTGIGAHRLASKR